MSEIPEDLSPEESLLVLDRHEMIIAMEDCLRAQLEINLDGRIADVLGAARSPYRRMLLEAVNESL